VSLLNDSVDMIFKDLLFIGILVVVEIVVEVVV